MNVIHEVIKYCIIYNCLINSMSFVLLQLRDLQVVDAGAAPLVFHGVPHRRLGESSRAWRRAF